MHIFVQIIRDPLYLNTKNEVSMSTASKVTAQTKDTRADTGTHNENIVIIVIIFQITYFMLGMNNMAKPILGYIWQTQMTR